MKHQLFLISQPVGLGLAGIGARGLGLGRSVWEVGREAGWRFWVRAAWGVELIEALGLATGGGFGGEPRSPQPVPRSFPWVRERVT